MLVDWSGLWTPACVSCHFLLFSYMVAALKQGSMTLPRRYSQDSQDGTLERLKVYSIMYRANPLNAE